MIAAVAAGIPHEFFIYSAHFVLGPILHGTSRMQSRLHSHLLDMNLQSVNLGWQSSPTRDGRMYFLSFIEPLPTADPKQPAPAWIQTLYSDFAGASADKIHSDIDLMMSDYRMVVSESGGSFIGSKSIGDVKLPHELHDSQAASHLNYASLRGVRSTIARVFAGDGWKHASGLRQAGVYELRKTSPGGRRLGLLFLVEKRGQSSRSICGTMQLVAERKRLALRVRAERGTRRDYEVPNSEVLRQVLDNMRVVVKYLEHTWVTELEEVLGPAQRHSLRGDG
jgi:hypothetical protein